MSKSYTSGNVNTFEECFPSSARKPRGVAIEVQYVVQIENSTSAAWNEKYQIKYNDTRINLKTKYPRDREQSKW